MVSKNICFKISLYYTKSIKMSILRAVGLSDFFEIIIIYKIHMNTINTKKKTNIQVKNVKKSVILRIFN